MSSVLFYTRGGGGGPIDPTKLLDELWDQPELITRLLHTFQAEAQKDIDQLETAIAAQDPSTVTALAHRLKGSSATVGAEPLKLQAAQIEAIGRRGDLQQASAQMPALHNEFDRFCAYVQELRDLE